MVIHMSDLMARLRVGGLTDSSNTWSSQAGRHTLVDRMIARERSVALLLLVSGALLSCDSEVPSEPTMPPPDTAIELSGLWDFTQVLIISSRLVVCRDTGTYNITQADEGFTANGDQVGTCRGLFGSFSSAGPFTVTDGQIDGTSISFSLVDGCRYIGTISTSSAGLPQRMSGSSACSVNFDGSWEAVAATPVTSVDLLPDSAELVVGETIHLTAAVRNASGARVFERAMAWVSSDPATAAVSDSGTVTGINAGTASVTVTVEGLSAEAEVSARFVTLTSVEAGLFHTCGISSDGTAYCWGVNDQGQAGPMPGLAPCPGFPCRKAPGAVPGVLPFSALSPGFQNTCGIATDGSAYCWGVNTAGQLGTDSSFGSATPVAVSGGLTFSSLSVGSNHVCGVAPGGTAYCWGVNVTGQLGTGSKLQSSAPQAVVGDLTFSSVSAGELHTCGVTPGGAAYCWGYNFDGQLGIDSVLIESTIPLPVAGGHSFTVVSSGLFHTCGLASDGAAHCWGRGSEGQLGVDSTEFIRRPVAVSGGLRFTSLGSGAFHTCALSSNGSVYCWGEGSAGQLGNGITNDSSAPVLVGGEQTFLTVSAGLDHTCGYAADGVAYCWGSNFNGQVGSASPSNSTTPVRVVGQP